MAIVLGLEGFHKNGTPITYAGCPGVGFDDKWQYLLEMSEKKEDTARRKEEKQKQHRCKMENQIIEMV